MSAYHTNLVHRTELVLGTEALKKIEQIRVIVIGVGGVGSWCAEALVRSGIGHVTVVDSDIVCATNANRQAQAASSTVGLPKVDEMAKRMRDISPDADICAINKPFTPETCDEFNLAQYDYVIDAIDSIANKLFLLEYCARNSIKIYASMGAAARTDPSKIRTALISDTHGCPLARAVRLGLRKRHVTNGIPCVFSDEPAVKPAVKAWCGTGSCSCNAGRAAVQDEGVCAVDWCAQKKQINGSLMHITGIFGLTLAGMVIRDAAGIELNYTRKR